MLSNVAETRARNSSAWAIVALCSAGLANSCGATFLFDEWCGQAR